MSTVYPTCAPICTNKQWKDAAEILFDTRPKIQRTVEEFQTLYYEPEFFPGILFSVQPPVYFQINPQIIASAVSIFRKTQKLDQDDLPEALTTLAERITLALDTYEQIIINVPIDTVDKRISKIKQDPRYRTQFEIPPTKERVTSYAMNLVKETPKEEKRERWRSKRC